MKGIYISVPDEELPFYMQVFERLKSATILKVEEVNKNHASGLHPWQIEELEKILLEEEANPQPGIDAFVFLKELREGKHV